jgi:tRNA(Ile2)-agmatinylcytidine synthase
MRTVSIHVGIDDTDSPRMGCTTYVVALLVEQLQKLGAVFVDYPNLVRLNPNVPWKTRGNGALCLRFRCDENLREQVKSLVVDTVEKNSDMVHARTEPGVVFFEGRLIPKELTEFAEHTIQGIVKMNDALKLIRVFKAEAVAFKSGRGIIGALAAVGATLEEDNTYELIAYRTPENRGTPRRLDVASVRSMNEKTAPYTFNNIDPETGRVLITPHGPDPILYGIRGETPSAVKQACRIVKSLEPVERWMIFRTNHGTDAHLRKVKGISEVLPYHSVIMEGWVNGAPKIVPRRHVVFSIEDASGRIDCAAYEPTGELRKAAVQLIGGDIVEVYGGVRPASHKYGLTVNLEKIRVVNLTPMTVLSNPSCPKCGKRMSSMGKNQGFRCDKCGFRDKTLTKIATESARSVEKKLHVTSPRSQRHLTKPLCRYGREKKGKPERLIRRWRFP